MLSEIPCLRVAINAVSSGVPLINGVHEPPLFVEYSICAKLLAAIIALAVACAFASATFKVVSSRLEPDLITKLVSKALTLDV